MSVALPETLKSHSNSVPAGKNTIVDEKTATALIEKAGAENKDIALAQSHPGSDKTVAPFIGLAVVEKGGDFVRFPYAPRPLSDDDIEIDVQFCGICGSDLHTFDCGWGHAKFPVITGHEIVGKVSRVGPGVSRIKVGDTVGVGAEVLACRQQSCRDCSRQDDAYCPKKVFTYGGTYPDGQWAFGGYQNKVRVHNEWAFIIPAKLDPAAAAPLLCAGVTVFAPLKRHVKIDDRIGVVGIGGLGHIAIQYASKMGASQVTAISTSLRKKDDAIKMGATDFLVSTDATAMKAATYTYDIIVLTANPDNLNLNPFINLLRTGGTLIVVAAPETPFVFSGSTIVGHRISVVGSLIGSKSEVQAALDFAALHGVAPIIERFPIQQASQAVQKMRDNTIKYRAVLELPLA